MFEQKPDHERTSRSSPNGETHLHPPNGEARGVKTESPRVTLREKEPALHRRTVVEEKRRGWPAWLHEAIGWGVALGILALFLGLQITLNRSISGPANTIALSLSVFVEISLIWAWDRYWY